MKKIVIATPGGKFTWEPSRETQKAIEEAGFDEPDVTAGLQDTFYSIFKSVETLMTEAATRDITNPGALRAFIRATILQLEEGVRRYLGRPRM